MKRFVLAALTGGFLLAGCHPAMAQAACGERSSLLKQLEGTYQEAPISMGLAANGSVIEVTRSDKGTWTILLTSPTGVTCLMAAGTNWENIKQKPKRKPS